MSFDKRTVTAKRRAANQAAAQKSTKGAFRIEVGEKLFVHGAEESLDFSASLGLIRRGVSDENAKRSGNAGHLLAAVDLPIINVEAPRAYLTQYCS
ncbi:MAG: hypothetical protein ACRD1N_11850 [Terriglobia bacterium]